VILPRLHGALTLPERSKSPSTGIREKPPLQVCPANEERHPKALKVLVECFFFAAMRSIVLAQSGATTLQSKVRRISSAHLM